MQIIIGGLIIGCIYALAAFGLVLIYRTTDVINFSHGEIAMISTFVSFVFLNSFGLSYVMSFLLSLVFASVFGLLVYQFIMKRVQNENPLNQVVLTLGLYMVFNGIAALIWGHESSVFPQAFSGKTFQIGTVFVTDNEIFLVGLTLILMLLFFLVFRYTKIGLAMRAAAQDTMATQLMGIKVSGVFMGAWAIAAVLGGIAGVMTAPITYLHTNMMLEVLMLAFGGAILGGFISLPGAVLGGLLIGVFGNLVSYYIASEMKIVFTFLLIILVLYVRPQGLFGGAKMVKKV